MFSSKKTKINKRMSYEKLNLSSKRNEKSIYTLGRLANLILFNNKFASMALSGVETEDGMLKFVYFGSFQSNLKMSENLLFSSASLEFISSSDNRSNPGFNWMVKKEEVERFKRDQVMSSLVHYEEAEIENFFRMYNRSLNLRKVDDALNQEQEKIEKIIFVLIESWENKKLLEGAVLEQTVQIIENISTKLKVEKVEAIEKSEAM